MPRISDGQSALTQPLLKRRCAARDLLVPPADPGNETVDIAFVLAVIVTGVGMEGGTHRRPIAPVDTLGIARHQILDGGPVD